MPNRVVHKGGKPPLPICVANDRPGYWTSAQSAVARRLAVTLATPPCAGHRHSGRRPPADETERSRRYSRAADQDRPCVSGPCIALPPPIGREARDSVPP